MEDFQVFELNFFKFKQTNFPNGLSTKNKGFV